MPARLYTLRDIRDFVITKRPAGDYELFFSFDPYKLPHHARVLDGGSGRYQELARWMERVRPDVTVISADPSLALPIAKKSLDALGVTYEVTRRDGTRRDTTANERRARIRKSHHNAIAAIAPHWPVRDGSFDRVYDNHGAFTYFPNDRGILAMYLEETARILKDGGKAGIIPLDLMAERREIGYRNVARALEGKPEEDELPAVIDRSRDRMEALLRELGISTYRFFSPLFDFGTASYVRWGVEFTKG